MITRAINQETEQCAIGDVYLFFYKVSGFPLLSWLEQSFVEHIGFRGANPNFEIEQTYIDEATGYFVVQAKVTQNPLPFLAVFGIIVVGTGGLLALIGLEFVKVEKLIKDVSFPVIWIFSLIFGLKILQTIKK